MLAFLAAPSASRAATMPSCRSGDPVVWVNTNTHVYHLKGDRYYGKTKAGDYECQSKAVAGGAHAAGATSSSSAKKPASSAAMAAPAVASPAPSTKKKKHHKPAATPTP